MWIQWINNKGKTVLCTKQLWSQMPLWYTISWYVRVHKMCTCWGFGFGTEILLQYPLPPRCLGWLERCSLHQLIIALSHLSFRHKARTTVAALNKTCRSKCFSSSWHCCCCYDYMLVQCQEHAWRNKASAYSLQHCMRIAWLFCWCITKKALLDHRPISMIVKTWPRQMSGRPPSALLGLHLCKVNLHACIASVTEDPGHCNKEATVCAMRLSMCRPLPDMFRKIFGQ